MDSQALYQILYQNETLFKLKEAVLPDALPVEKLHIVPPLLPIDVTPIVPTQKQQIIESKISPVQPEALAFPTLTHKILIISDDTKNKTLIDSEAVLLDNILKAVGHSSDKTDILNFSFLQGADARQVLSNKRINFFITFGVPLIKLHLDLLLVPYTPKLVEGIWFLLADPLVVIDSDNGLKRKLWVALKKMFEMA